MALPSRRRLVNADGDSGECDIADPDPASAGVRTEHALQALGGLPDGVDVMAQAQPGLEGGLRTEGEG